MEEPKMQMCGSSALPQPIQKEWETVTGHRLLERYGMTEVMLSIAMPDTTLYMCIFFYAYVNRLSIQSKP